MLPETIIKNIGNHEFFNYDAVLNSPEQVQTFINRYLEFSGDGHSDTADITTAYVSENQLKWLKGKLADKY